MARRVARSGAVRSPPASPVFGVPTGSMSRMWASSSAIGQCSTRAARRKLACLEVNVAIAQADGQAAVEDEEESSVSRTNRAPGLSPMDGRDGA